MADQLADGRRFRALTVIDLFTWECVAIDIGQGPSGQDVAATLERLRFERGLPQRIYGDNGTEFVSAAMDLWAYTNGVILDFSRGGKPTDNATIERRGLTFIVVRKTRSPQRVLRVGYVPDDSAAVKEGPTIVLQGSSWMALFHVAVLAR